MIKQSARSGVEMMITRFRGQITERYGHEPADSAVRAFLQELQTAAREADRDIQLGLREAKGRL